MDPESIWRLEYWLFCLVDGQTPELNIFTLFEKFQTAFSTKVKSIEIQTETRQDIL